MTCPFCGTGNYRCIDSRQHITFRRRRYECNDCGKRFSTTETIDGVTIQQALPKKLALSDLKRCYERENYEAATGVKEAFNHCSLAVEYKGKDYCPFKGNIPGHLMRCVNVQKFITGD